MGLPGADASFYSEKDFLPISELPTKLVIYLLEGVAAYSGY